jgi:cytochrome b561
MALGNVIDNLFLKYTASMLLLITLTFPDDVRSTHAAHRRLNRFMNDIRQRYPGYLLFLTFLAHLSAVLFHTLIIRDRILDRMVLWSARSHKKS